MSNEEKASDAKKTSRRPHVSADELEALGLTPAALEAAIGRAKVKAQRKQRPKLDTNPELDAWFD